MIYSGGSCYGDLPIHMYLAESFLIGGNKHISWSGMTSPIFAGERLTYPFLPDFHAAIFRPLGDTLHEGFLYPSFMMATAMWGILYCFTVRVTGSRLGGALSVLLTIGAGGMGGPRWIQAVGWNSAMTRDVVQHDPTGEWKYLWFAFVPHILLPQRGACFAYPMAVLCLLLVWVGSDNTSAGAARPTPLERRHLLIGAALAAGSLPMVQAHSFIGCGVIIIFIALLDCYKWLADPTLMVDWALAGIVAAVTGGPQMLLFQKTVTQGYYGKFLAYGWLYEHFEFGKPLGVIGWFNMWWYSLGPTVHLFVVLILAYAAEAAFGWRIGSRAAKKVRVARGRARARGPMAPPPSAALPTPRPSLHARPPSPTHRMPPAPSPTSCSSTPRPPRAAARAPAAASCRPARSPRRACPRARPARRPRCWAPCWTSTGPRTWRPPSRGWAGCWARTGRRPRCPSPTSSP